MEALKLEPYYTYEDWLAIDDDKRYELIDGALFMMAEPSRRHQGVLGELYGQIWEFLASSSVFICHYS